MTVPGAEQDFAEALTLTFGSDHHVHAPRAGHAFTLDAERDRHGRVLADDRAALAGDPDLWEIARIVRVLAILPVPAQARRFRGVRSEHAAIQGLGSLAIFQ